MTLAICQGNLATCRWLGLPNDACCAMTWRLGLTSARHAIKTSQMDLDNMLNNNAIDEYLTIKSFKSQLLMFKQLHKAFGTGTCF